MKIPAHVINIEIDQVYLPTSIKPAIQRAASEALPFLAADQQIELTILICDDEYMQELNLTYRGQDKTTDVLSFEDRFEVPGSEMTYMGDIAISYPTALKQASRLGHALEAEISLLTVHGILHLFGHDHQDEAEKQEMWSIQAKIMESIGFSNITILTDDSSA